MNIYRNREIFTKIKDLIDIPEILAIHGSRQVGKTTLMKMLIKDLQEKHKNDIFYFDLEEEKNLLLFEKGADEVIKYTEARQRDGGSKVYIFIDEVQYLDNPSSLLKIFYDHYKDRFKLVVSGSSSFAIKSKFKDSLVGRIIDFELFGLSFREFLDFKGLNYNFPVAVDIVHEELKAVYKEYVLYGFYPQVVLAKTIPMKELYLNNIIEKYLYKDMMDLAGIRDVRKFNNLIKCLAAQAGSLVNVNELSDTLNISRPTIEEYLFILENTYIIRLVYPYHKNVRSELTKMPKVYFEDSGALNILRNKKLAEEFDGGMLENSVYTCLRRLLDVRRINYWRTSARQEVDFVIDGEQPLPIEVKLSYRDRNIKNLLYFSEKYKVKNKYCATYNKLAGNRKDIKQVYPWELEDLLLRELKL